MWTLTNTLVPQPICLQYSKTTKGELDALIVVRLPKHKKTIHCEWIFERKEGLSPSEPARFKARLVAKGFS